MTDLPCTGNTGQRSGYRRHQRRGEIACTPCLEAERAYQRARKQQLKAKKEDAA